MDSSDATRGSLGYMLHLDTRRFIEREHGARNWVRVYGSLPDEDGSLYSALIDNDRVPAALEEVDWDMMIGDGTPGCTISYAGKKKVVTYDRFGGRDGAEPLVLVRDFHGLRPSYTEISEEFRLFHNLFRDSRSGSYLKFNESGDEEEVIRVHHDEVQIRLKEIRQYLAIKEMHLALYFDFVRHSQESLSALNPPASPILVRNDLMAYEVAMGPTSFETDRYRSLSRLLGKKFIPPAAKEESNFWPYEKRRSQHAEFIIGVDAKGNPILQSSNPQQLSDLYNDRSAPHYLTPVYFKREVLAKYYGKPSRYTVVDGLLRCAGLWSVQIDMDVKNFVIVFLGDLGRDMPYEDQVHWKTYNVYPEGGISASNFKRSMLAEFADPEHLELVFKMKFKQVNDLWCERFQWHLFKPLAADDGHLLPTLRVPLHEDQAEFDPHVLGLTKILVDSLNERELQKYIPKQPDNTKGITKFERYLELKKMPDAHRHIKFLRDLQSLRAGVGHRKGDDYRKACSAFGIPDKSFLDAFESILERAIALLDGLEQHFLSAAMLPVTGRAEKP